MESETDETVEHMVKGHKVEALVAKQQAGCLYRAQQRDSEEPILLFTLQYDTLTSPKIVDAFFERLDLIETLEHPDVPAILESGLTDEKRPFFITPRQDVQPLDAYQADQAPATDPIKPLTFVRQLAEMLKATHQVGLIHYDLRPLNLLITPLERPILLDLAVPTACTPDESALSHLSVNALDYASPEQLEGKMLTPISNIYSMGVILYEQLAGHLPYIPASGWDIFERRHLPQETPLHEARKGLAPETYAVVRDALWRQEWSRTESLDLFIAGLETAVQAEKQLAEKRSKKPVWKFWQR